MRILIVSADYDAFLSSLYGADPTLAESGYIKQQTARAESLFGMADFYSRNLRALGHCAVDVHVNNPWMQLAWVKENRQPSTWSSFVYAGSDAASHLLHGNGSAQRVRGAAGALRHIGKRQRSWLLAVLQLQIAQFSPDVILNQAMDWVPTSAIRRATQGSRAMIVGQIAAPLPRSYDFRGYHLVVSSLPNFVSYFRERGIAAEYHPLAFEPAILSEFANIKRDIDVSFVGSISPHHRSRVALLEALARHTRLRFWGLIEGVNELDASLRACYQGPAWGRAMYAVMARSRITVNQHIDIAGRFANNQRLYEATGMGALLVTDRKDNLAELFDVGSEVLDYDDVGSCVETVLALLNDDPGRANIAAAGQSRTLTEHSYVQRMAGLVRLLDTHANRLRLRE